MNKLYCGNNLDIMRDMPDASIDLIATDPPFCTQRDWGAFDDRWDDGLKGYLKYMEERCVEMHRLLKDTGSLYLHCDSKASHYLKVMLDNIFGIKQFRNDIVWSYRRWAISNNSFGKMHDNVLFYTITNKAKWNKLTESISPKNKHKYKRHTSYTDEGKQIQVYTDEPNIDTPMRDVWDVSVVNGRAKERTGYPTQKPNKLYQRIIKASSNEGDIVLDPFCGSGTTCVAAHSLSRKYIGIDQNPDAIKIAEERLKQLNLFTEV